MTVLLAVSLLLVAASGLVVLLTESPLAQAVVLSVHGLILTIVFVAFGAPDVALSQLAVGAAVVPLMVLLALGKTRRPGEPGGNARPRREPGPGGESSRKSNRDSGREPRTGSAEAG